MGGNGRESSEDLECQGMVAFADVGEICLLTVRCPGRLDRLVKYSENTVRVQWRPSGTVDIIWYSGDLLVQWIPSGTVETFWYSSGYLMVKWTSPGTVALQLAAK